MKTPKFLVLASQSPRRRKILGFAGISFRIAKPHGVEETPVYGEKPALMVQRLALAKAKAISKDYPDSLVLGADTTVVCGKKIFGKPQDQEQAREMLQNLQKRGHEVWTGVALVRAGRCIGNYAERSRVWFRRIKPRELEEYIKSSEPYDKAGAYDIQGKARDWIVRWEGDFFNVMGLPLRWVILEINRVFKRSKKS